MANSSSSEVDAMPFNTLTDFEMLVTQCSIRKLYLDKFENNGFIEYFRNYRTDIDNDNNPALKKQYFDTDEINAITKGKNIDISVCHVNVRRIAKNKGKLLAFLSTLEHKFNVIVLTEIGDNANHFLNDNLLEGYDFYHKLPIKNNKYGGVAILVKEGIGNTICRDDLEALNTCTCDKCTIENIWIEINTLSNEKYIIGGIYRHPNGNTAHFITDIKNSLNKLDPKATCIFTGDTNIDLVKYDQGDTLDYYTTLTSYNFLPYILTPTRITDHTATSIDHIFVRHPNKLIDTKITSGNILAEIADHLPNFIFFHKKSCNSKKSNERPYIRIYSDKNISRFKCLLSETDWNYILREEDVNMACNNFYSHLLNLYNESFPLTRLSRKRAKDKKWITAGLRKSTQMKYRLYKKQLSNPTIDNINKYKTYSNALNSAIEKAEILYYNELFSMRKKGINNFWKTLGQTLNPKKVKSKNVISKLLYRNEEITGNENIANAMNKHFCEVGYEINKKIPSVPGHFKDYLQNKVEETFYLSPIIEFDVTKELSKLCTNKSAGPDTLTPKLIKLCKQEFVTPLTILYNKSIEAAVYPSDFKLAKVIALYKKNSRSVPSNYRPISLLNCFNKIFESIVSKQFLKFIEKHKIIYINQFGFRKGYSTTLALIDVVDYIRKAIDNNEYVIGIFLDLEKAFDSIHHGILLSKLAHYGFRGHVNNFLRSYLSQRQQYTQINNCNSTLSNITYGVPQGSILGPLLFTLFINDIGQAMSNCKTNLFADDTSMLYKHKDINNLVRTCENSLKDICRWFKLNKLSLSLGKSSFVVFHGIRKDPQNQINKIKISGHEIQRADSVKYIGLTLDETLSWNNHINELCKNITKYFSVFYNLRHIVNNKLARTIYYTCIHSRIKYGIEIYGTAAKTRMDKLQTIQNKLMKLLTRKDRRYSTDQLHLDLDILKVNDIHKLSTLNFVYKCISGDTIPNFVSYFTMRDSMHAHPTSLHHEINKPQVHTETGKLTTHYTGAKFWNDLSHEIKSSENIDIFKRNLKTSMKSKYTTV